MTELNLATIIEGGAVGLCALTLGVLAYVFKKYACLSSNHIKHNTEHIIRNTAIQTKLSEKMKQDIDVGKEILVLLRTFNGHK